MKYLFSVLRLSPLKYLIVVASFLLIADSSNDNAAAQDFEFPTVANSLEDFSTILSSAAWRWQSLEPKIIFVCWENPSSEFSQQMESVRDAVSDTWEFHSQVKFQGWERCEANNKGIRISISDIGPHTKGLGVRLNGVQNGMVLNFTFSNWSAACKSTGMYQKCVRSIAVHEFGHALGFAHEQNRPDTPGECAVKAQGTTGDVLLTPWDRHSVMNYCNPVYNNNGVLSDFDIVGLQDEYGEPQ